ncbi:MAG TPA: Crp/Fnr family transcriptional regulator [Cyclobacteriaceae bacterium]|jgi:CRP-like cAMP-binding protein
MNFESIIKNVCRIIDLSDDEIAWFIRLLDKREFGKKEYVLRANDICRHQTYVVSGCLKISQVDANGTENIVKFAVEDWWVYDLKSFMEQSPATYSIQVIEPAHTFQLSKSNFDLLHESIPKFEKFSRVMFQNSYIQLQNRVTQNLSATAEEKYQHFQEKYPGLELRISQKEIAAYLGITPVFLSMLRKKWAAGATF